MNANSEDEEIKKEINIYKLKVSKSASFSEMQEALRLQLGNPDYCLSEEQYERFVKLNKIEEEVQMKMKTSLGKFYSEYEGKTDAQSLKRKKELNDFAQFMHFWPSKIELINVRESPDFVINVDDQSIGLELTGIYDEEVVAQISTLQSICDKVQTILREQNPNAKILFNVNFNNIIDLGRQRIFVTQKLSAFLQLLIDNKNDDLPEFINQVIRTPHSDLQVVLSEKYLLNDLDIESLEMLISQKEKKLGDYKKNTGLNEQWLLIILEGASAKSNNDIDLSALPKHDTTFDKIIIFNTFKRIAIQTLK